MNVMEVDYIDRTILRLRREYSKDELVSALNKQLTEKDIEIGKLKSEVEELKYDIETKYSPITNLSEQEIELASYISQLELKIKSLEASNKDLKTNSKRYKKIISNMYNKTLTNGI